MLSATKILLGSIPAMALIMGVSAVSTTGDYHHGASLKCSQCHTMHYSATHSYSGSPSSGYVGTTGPYTYLLQGEINELCLRCHNSGGKDVLGLGSTLQTNGRLAGALNWADGEGTNDPGYEHWMGHSLGSTDTAPGGTFSNPDGLSCTDCHHQHGYQGYGSPLVDPVVTGGIADYWTKYGTYRNLIGNVRQITYVAGNLEGGNNLFVDVYEVDDDVDHYSWNNVDYNEPANTESAYADFCGMCHSDFHGGIGDTNTGGNTANNHEFLRHPTQEVNIGGQPSHGHTSLGKWDTNLARVKVMSETGDWTTAGNATLTPSCFSCHRSHGNMNPYGLIYMDRFAATADITEEGIVGAASYNTCSNCHVQGL
ncbi:MAG: hypothetical protein H8E31_10560 [Planctomycetes bacterium]|nr:hypothetical protein [Planctomycetota bacterium]